MRDLTFVSTPRGFFLASYSAEELGLQAPIPRIHVGDRKQPGEATIASLICGSP